MIRILLVDDHPVVRHGIRTILTDRFHDAVVAEAGDAPSALREVGNAEWDVVLLDISMPGPSGLDLIKQLRRERPALPLLVVSMHPAAQFARRALSAGAIGYLTKDSAPEDFVTAIEHARRGRRYVGPDATEGLLRWKDKTVTILDVPRFKEIAQFDGCYLHLERTFQGDAEVSERAGDLL